MDKAVYDKMGETIRHMEVRGYIVMGGMASLILIHLAVTIIQIKKAEDRAGAVRNVQSENLPLYQAEIERCEAAGGKPLFAVEFWGDGDGRLAASMDSPLRTADGNIACLRDAALIDQRPR